MTAPLLPIHAIGYTDSDRASLDVPHVAEPQADRHWHTTIMRWRWHMTCEDGTQLTAIQFADDLLVSDAHHQDIQHLAAVLRTTALAH
jgi:gamma-glutamyl-gamma-aminobutyrate hydrolase PuuD